VGEPKKRARQTRRRAPSATPEATSASRGCAPDRSRAPQGQTPGQTDFSVMTYDLAHRHDDSLTIAKCPEGKTLFNWTLRGRRRRRGARVRSTLREDPRRPENGHQSLRVANLPGASPFERLRKPQPVDLDEFMLFVIAGNEAQVRGQIEVEYFVAKAGGAEDGPQADPCVGVQPSLFLELPAGRRERRLAGVEFSRWNFPYPSPRRVPILAYQTDSALRIQREGACTARVPHDLQLQAGVFGQLHPLYAQVHELTLVDGNALG
jgi:hypothetical protein